MTDTIYEIRKRIKDEKLHREENLLQCEKCLRYVDDGKEGARLPDGDFVCFDCMGQCENLIGTGEYRPAEYYRPIEIKKRCPGRIVKITKDGGVCDTCKEVAIYEPKFKYYVPESEEL